jgi:CRISPR system Cascade subunit CasC
MARNQFVNLHIIQSVPASLLNRDDAGSAKGILVGNIRRDRVSSQSWKRSIRLAQREQLADGAVDGADFGVRTNRLPREVVDRLVTEGRDRNIAEAKTVQAFTTAGLKCKDGKPQTAVQLYVAAGSADRIADMLNLQFDNIGDKVPADVTEALITALDPDRAVDIALFGRFISELKRKKRIDGAVSVSHAFGVTPTTVEQDYWTAVDDVQNDEDTASSNLGTVDLTAPVFYRHIVIDRAQLATNLAATDINPADVEAMFLRTAVTAVPSAKKTGTAAHTLPALVAATVSDQDLSAADAYTTAITGTDVITAAGDALLDKLNDFTAAGVDQTVTLLPLSREARALTDAETTVVPNIDDLIASIAATAAASDAQE